MRRGERGSAGTAGSRTGTRWCAPAGGRGGQQGADSRGDVLGAQSAGMGTVPSRRGEVLGGIRMGTATMEEVLGCIPWGSLPRAHLRGVKYQRGSPGCNHGGGGVWIWVHLGVRSPGMVLRGAPRGCVLTRDGRLGAPPRAHSPATPNRSAPLSSTSSTPQKSHHPLGDMRRGDTVGELTLSSACSGAGRQRPSAGQEPPLVEDLLQVLQLLLLQQRGRLPPLAQPLADVLLAAQAPGGLGDLQLQRQVPLQGAQRVLGTEGTCAGTPPPTRPSRSLGVTRWNRRFAHGTGLAGLGEGVPARGRGLDPRTFKVPSNPNPVRDVTKMLPPPAAAGRDGEGSPPPTPAVAPGSPSPPRAAPGSHPA